MKLTVDEAAQFQSASKALADFVFKLSSTSLARVVPADDLKNAIDASAVVDRMAKALGREEVVLVAKS